MYTYFLHIMKTIIDNDKWIAIYVDWCLLLGVGLMFFLSFCKKNCEELGNLKKIIKVFNICKVKNIF